VTTLTTLTPMLLGIKWMDPTWLLAQFGSEFFWISLLIVFIECGLLFPFLPGDTLLFAIGLFIATDKIDVFGTSQAGDLVLSLLLMVVAAVAGNVAGYEIGRLAGEPLRRHDGRVLKRRHLDQTTAFFDRHGNKALVIGRFVPFVRTYITLIAGVTRLARRRFLVWSLVGAVLWATAVMLAGYFLGAAFPKLGENIDVAMVAILAFSLIPVAVEWWRHRGARQADAAGDGAAGSGGVGDTPVRSDRA
jgi:membrane-associated protein